MSLAVLGPLVVLGIAGIVLLVHLLGWSRGGAFADEAAARKAFAEDYPDAQVEEAALADDGRAALMRTDRGVGYVSAFGDGRVTRLLAAGEVSDVRETGTGLKVSLADWGAPSLALACADREKRVRMIEIASAAKEAAQ